MTDSTPTGAALLDWLRAALTRYVILPSAEAADAVTLWIAATHAQPAWAHAPRLVIRGPEKRCGKSRLLDIVEATCHAPFITVNSSSAAVYRSITEDPPTMLVDEADTIFGPKADGNEDLRGLLNAGHQRNRPAKRYDAATNRVESIPTFAMAALAGIGAMPDTIEDRAVVVRMRRRAPGETAAPYRHRRDRTPLRDVAAALNQWLRADLAVLEEAEPAMPVEDRAADTWEPLVIVADHAGASWPERARAAAVTLTAEADDNDQSSARVRLLATCRTAFGDDTALPTATLLERLKADPEGEWNDHGLAGLTAMKLGAMLREYDIRSGNIRFPNGQAKGYQRADFADAWARYCPAVEPVPEADILPLERGSRPSRPSLVTPAQSGTASNSGTA
ncbi:DUF3631 domain-containing protein [Nonomuraea mesophila]|uniref:DUF3631 domain-containing protein n=1 Tax=Nonomuraea mesophila TaxID=2530382 RepID=UPI0015F2CDBC|nr:DUF3631 domain-containing protein [Nonomuraea mesophila]